MGNRHYNIVLASTIAALISIASYKLADDSILTKKDFEEVYWGMYENPDGKIEEEWINEKGKHSQKMENNRLKYFSYADSANNGKLTGKILLPDLNEDGEINGQKLQYKVLGKVLFDKNYYKKK
jgi:hypothetical protein